MERPTATLRRLLILESIQDHITRQIAIVKQQMKSDGLSIIERKVNSEDIWIQFKHKNVYDEAIFMKKMLDAESKNRAKRTGMTL